INLDNIIDCLSYILNLQTRYDKDSSRVFSYEFLFVILYGITPLTLGTLDPVDCDVVDPIGLCINTYLYGLGIATMVCHGAVLLAQCVPCSCCSSIDVPGKEMGPIMKFLYFLF